MQTIPHLETKRLILRGFTVADCEPLSAFHSSAAKFESHQPVCFFTTDLYQQLSPQDFRRVLNS